MYSIVIPCYKSSHTLKKLVTLTTEEMQKMNREDLEFVLVNDCSPDGGKTLEVLRQLAEENENVRVINLAKNVGQHNAMMAGLRYAKGDTIISMDDDMQTHPSQLPKMFAEYDRGMMWYMDIILKKSIVYFGILEVGLIGLQLPSY